MGSFERPCCCWAVPFLHVLWLGAWKEGRLGGWRGELVPPAVFRECQGTAHTQQPVLCPVQWETRSRGSGAGAALCSGVASETVKQSSGGAFPRVQAQCSPLSSSCAWHGPCVPVADRRGREPGSPLALQRHSGSPWGGRGGPPAHILAVHSSPLFSWGGLAGRPWHLPRSPAPASLLLKRPLAHKPRPAGAALVLCVSAWAPWNI